MSNNSSVKQIRWPLARETVALFGAFISEERAHLTLSPDTFVAGMNRNEEWLRATERGEIQLTKTMVEDIGVAFKNANKLIDVEQVAGDLQNYPLGKEGQRLRALTPSIDAPGSDKRAQSESGIEAIAGIDRMLVMAPGILVLAFLTLVARMLEWSLTSSKPATGKSDPREPLAELLDAVLLPSVVVATLFLALGLLAGERLLRTAARKLRPALSEADLEVVRKLCLADGITYPVNSDWKFGFLQPHLIERHRNWVTSTALRTAFCERAVPALIASILLSVLGAFLAIRIDGFAKYDAGPIMLIALGLVLLLLAHRESKRSSDECAAEVTRGLGWKLDRAQEQRLQVSPKGP